MNDTERQALFVVADISGYTKFIFSNEKDISHSQMIIRELITALLDEIKLPLQLIRIEGDALFLYALMDDPERPWEQESEGLVINLIRLFQVFSDKVSELTIHKICSCVACTNIERLKLKAVVHSGLAAFYEVNGHQELTGTGPIVVHRLLKNSVESDEYILVTEAANGHLELPGGEVVRGEEVYDDIGSIRTYTYTPPAPEVYRPLPTAAPPTIFIETLRSEVSHEYAQVADHPERGFHFHTGRRLAGLLEYRDEWISGFPEEVIESFAGTGNPFTLGELRNGQKVLDVGSGSGLDCLIAANMVGKDGEVVGVDMTEEMIEKARRSAKLVGVSNVSFNLGYMEHLPVDDGWADVVISNGAINLAPAKDNLFLELHRALRPGGRLQVADIRVGKPIPDNAKRNIDLWAG